MAEWLIERGIGETRAALIEDGAIVEAQIELPGALRAENIARARLARIVAPGRVGLIELDGGAEAMLQPLPKGLSEGASLMVEITREAIGHKRPLARAALPQATARDGPDLADRIAATGLQVARTAGSGRDALEEAGWSEALEAASSGVLPFEGGTLLMSLTPAMTLIDIDGTLAPDALALAGAAAAGRAIRLMGLAGSIGIDFPTVGGRAARQAIADALDAALPPPFERTAVNGFGFLQIVRPMMRPSLPQIIAADPLGAAARALLRRAERTPGKGARTISAHPGLAARLEDEPAWLEELARRTGTPIGLRANPALAISAWHVDAEHP